MVVLYHTDFCRAFEHSSAVVAAVAAAVESVGHEFFQSACQEHSDYLALHPYRSD